MTLPSLALLAGGMATRLGSLTEKIPKSLLPVAGHPFIHHQLKLFKSQGITDVVVCAGHYGAQIQDFAGDGARYGLSLRYSFDGPTLIGTGGALKKALPLLSDPFFVVYGDSYLEASFSAAAAAFKKSGKEALMTVFKNEGRYDQSNVEFEDGKILCYDKALKSPKMRHIDYGLGLFSKKALMDQAEESFDLASIYGKLVKTGRVEGLEVSGRFYEIGSPKGLEETHLYLSQK